MKMKSMIYVVVAIALVAFIGTVLVAKDDKKTVETVTCAVSGETVVKSEAKGPVNYDGKDYYFCCNSCLKKFKANPEKFVSKKDDSKTVCCGGMAVDKKTALKSTFKGKVYYFCNENCKASFDKDPEAYLKKEEETSKKHTGCKHAAECEKKCDAKTAKSGSGKKE